MSQRSDRIYLAADEARCEPLRAVPQCHKCARKLAEIPPMGRLQDYSLSLPLFSPWCAHFAACTKPTDQPVKKEVKPWPSL